MFESFKLNRNSNSEISDELLFFSLQDFIQDFKNDKVKRVKHGWVPKQVATIADFDHPNRRY